MRLRGTQQPVVVTAKRLIECNQPCTDQKCHVALKQRKALNIAFTPSRIWQSRHQSLRAMQQSYAAICLLSTRKVPRHGLDSRVTAGLKSQCCRSSSHISRNVCLSQVTKKLNSTERGARFRHSCVSKVITTAHAHKSGVIFHFSKSFETKN